MKTPRLFVQFPVSGRTVRLKIAEAIVLRDDCVDFVLEDGRMFRMGGEVLGTFGSLLPQMDTVYLSEAPPWHPSPQ